MANAKQQAFIKSAPGKYFNPDNAYGYQCKDLIDSYVMEIFGGSWVDTIRPGNANVCFNGSNSAYFTKILNDPQSATQLPQYGDIICWGGNGVNPYGHIAIVVSADQNGVSVIQQDGYLQSATWQGYLKYTNAGTGVVQGWLRPKAEKMIGGETNAKVQTVWLPASAGSWNVYRENGPYTVGNQIGKLNPSLFGGLNYQVLGYKAGNTCVVIQTRDFGTCAIYVANGTGAVVK